MQDLQNDWLAGKAWMTERCYGNAGMFRRIEKLKTKQMFMQLQQFKKKSVCVELSPLPLASCRCGYCH
jgi:hypothetical protein